MPFQKDRYPDNWKEISLRIRERDGWRCKLCGAENGKPNPRTGSRVVLTVMHLGVPYPDGRPGDPHDKMDVRDENLISGCQACHLLYDLPEHMKNAARTRRRKRIEAGQMVLPEVEE